MASSANRLLIFDFDGVLCDLALNTERTRGRIRELFERDGFESCFRPLLASIEEGVDALAEQDIERARAARKAAWQIITDDEIEAAQSRCRKKAGVDRIFERLADIPLALYSNNHQQAVLFALAAIEIDASRFVSIRGRREDASLKPSPVPIVEIIEQRSPRPEVVLVIGDHPYDIQGALAAQTAFGEDGRTPQVEPIAITTGRASAAQLADAGARLIVGSLDELCELVLGRAL
jgi:HAD superfamily hydrolase (TIGR01549 family)